MKLRWSSRVMFSYFPIFLFTTSVLVFISFLIVNELSRTETKKADRISTSYVVDALDRELDAIDMDVMQEFQSNAVYNDFLNEYSDGRKAEGPYDTINQLRALISKNDWIESIYLYRIKDQTLLTTDGLFELKEFEDRPFVEESLLHPERRSWSSVREYAPVSTISPERVISIHKKLPLPFGTDGILVINVSVQAIERMVSGMTNSQISFMKIVGEDGKLIYDSHSGSQQMSGKVLTRLVSNRLPWTFESGIKAGQLFAWVSVVSYLWIGIGLLTILFSIVYIFYITRKNSRPIEVMMKRIQAIQLRFDDTWSKNDNELTVIDQALEKLIEQTTDYEKRHDENLLVERRQLFLDLLEGNASDSIPSKLQDLKPSNDDWDCVSFATIVAELDHYADFQQSYSVKDQNVLKFALMNIFEELGKDDHFQGWSEWIGGRRIGMLVASAWEHGVDSDKLRQIAERSRSWIIDNLRLSVSIGVGSIVSSWEEVQESYRAADLALSHRLSLGREAIVMSDGISNRLQVQSYPYLQLFSDLVREFRMTNEGWRFRLEELFERFQSEPIPDGSIHMLLQTLIQMLEREIASLSDAFRIHLDSAASGEIWASVENASSLEQVRETLSDWFDRIYGVYVAVNENNSYRAMVGEVRKYIEENFADPDLSLKHLSDRFEITGKYVSYLFKEEFDQNFAEFLTQLRMRKAEELLVSSNDTLQDIALKVGYANAITFGRVFKRTIGLTPGDYRKLRMNPSNW